MIVREMPYTNLHDLNIDWILKVVKDFQNRYQNLDETFQNMLQQIATAGENAVEAINNNEETALEAIRVFLEQCVQALNTETTDHISEIQNVTNNQLDAINAAGTNQIGLIDQDGAAKLSAISSAGAAQVNIINGLITTLPQTYEDSVNQLQIINAVLNQTYNYPPLVQGHYADSQESDSKTLVADNYRVSTLLSTGCASKKIKIQVTNVAGIIRDIIYWTGWGGDAISHTVSVSTSASDEKTLYTYTFPATATYFTIVFAYDYNMGTQLLVSDIQVSLQWQFTSLESIELHEHGFDVSNTNALEFVIPGNTNLTIEEGTEIDEIDIAGGSKSVATSHKLKDSTARESVSDLKDVTTTTIQEEITINIEPTWTSGYVTPGGVIVSSEEYIYTEINVNGGDVIRLFRTDSGVIGSARFTCVYIGNSVDENLGGANVSLPYTVPEGVTKVIFTILSDYTNASGTIMRTVNHLQIINKEEVDRLTTYLKTHDYIYKTTDTVNANSLFTLIDHLDAKKNTVLQFYGEFQNFTKLELCHGGAINYGSRVEITSDKVSVYYDNVAQPYISENHNLTISDFINVRVEQGNGADCYVYLMTKDGLFKSSRALAYHSCRGAVYAKSGTEMNNVKLQYVLKDMLSDVFIFGDSYISIADPSRYPKYLIEYGYDKYLLCGFGGANSLDEIPSFRAAMTIRKPNYCIWALGMNDGDSENAINTSWKTYADEVMDYCDANGIELIMATIPNTPTINNSFKNAYVKASGKRYVDFAKAVGAESAGSSWYAGMLSNDNVHPTSLGAKALCERLMLDVPEILIK